MEESELQKWLETVGLSGIDDVSDDLQSAMHFAFKEGNLAVAKKLQACGCSIEVRNGQNSLPTLLAAEFGHLAMLKWAKEQGVDLVNDTNEHGDSAMTMAVYGGNLEVMEYLYDCGVDLEKRSNNGFSLVLIAAENDRLEALKWLDRHGCDLGAKDARWNTPMILAAFANHVNVVRYLLEKGCDFKSADDTHLTPLMLAAQHGSLEMVQLFLERGANIFETDAEGETLGEIMATAGCLPSLELGLQYGLAITPKMLISAMHSGNLEMVRMLQTKTPIVPHNNLLPPLVGCGHIAMLDYVVNECKVDWNALRKPKRNETGPNNVWDRLLWVALIKAQLAMADHLVSKYGANASYDAMTPAIRGLVAEGVVESLKWLISKEYPLPALIDHVEGLDSEPILCAGKDMIKWLIENGWKGKAVEKALKDPNHWPHDHDRCIDSIRALIAHFNWNAKDLDEIYIESDENMPLSAVRFGILQGKLSFVKFLVQKLGCRLFDPADEKETKGQLLGYCLRSNSLGTLQWVLQQLELPLPNVFRPQPRDIILGMPTLGFRSSAWIHLFGSPEEKATIEEEEEEDDEEVDVEDHGFLSDLFISDDVEIFAWCINQCAPFGFSANAEEAILTAILGSDYVKHLYWIVDYQTHNPFIFSQPYLTSASFDNAIAMGAFKCAEWLYSAGVQLDRFDNSLGHILADESKPKLRWLQRNGMLDLQKPDLLNYDNFLHLTVHQDNKDAFLYMLRHGAPIGDYRLLFRIAKDRSPSILEWLLENGFG